MYDPEIAAAMAFADTAIDRFHRKAEIVLHRAPLLRTVQNDFELLTARARPSGRLAMSNPHVRRRATSTLIDVNLERFAEIQNDGDVRHFLFTACYDAGTTFETEPIVDLTTIQAQIYRQLYRRDLHGICAFEIDILARRVFHESSRRFLFHVHGIVWTRDPGFQPQVTANDMMASGLFPNDLGAPSISFMSRRQSATRFPGFVMDEPDRDQTAASMAYLAYYMLKAPCYAKNRVLRADGEGYRLLKTESDYTATSACRMLEAWSKIDAYQTVFGVGEGGVLSREFSARMREWERANRRRKRFIGLADDAAGDWQKLWAAHGRDQFRPCRIAG